MPVDVQAVVVANTRLSDAYNVIRFTAPEIAARARPGQFVMVKSATAVDPLLRRPFSLFEITRGADGRPTGFTLLSKRIGKVTTQLFNARCGDRFACLGPLGLPFDPVTPPCEAWIVAGGVGLAPFVTLAESLQALGTTTTLFYGARTASELFCIDLFEDIGVQVVKATDDGTAGRRGFVTDAVQEALSKRPTTEPVQLYACGPTPMMRRVSELATVNERSCLVSLEQVMGCGMGGCYSCVVRVREAGDRPHFVRSCLAGPVFDGSRIVWEELVH
jgi:dihydroorotate dehydrogenase electron transfer subunit